MRLVVDHQEFAVEADQSIRELKARFPLYLYAKKRRWVTSVSLLRGAAFISRRDLQAELVALNAAHVLSAAKYSLEDVLALNLDGEYDVWVALGQTLPPHVSANPLFFHETGGRAEPEFDKLLLDYLPLVDDTLYGCAPPHSVYLTSAEPGPPLPALPPLKTRLELVKTVKCGLLSKANRPLPLARAFQRLHATDQVPVLRLNSADPLYRVYDRVEFQTVLPPKDGTLTAVWRSALLCNFFEDGRVEIAYTPSQPVSLEVCNHRLRSRINPFISLLNRTLEMGTPFESDFQTSEWVEGAFPLFHEIEQVVNMKLVLEADEPLRHCKVSSDNVAQKINSCSGPYAALHLLRLGLTQEEAAAVLGGVPAKPLHLRLEGNQVALDNLDNLHYLSFLNNSESEPVVQSSAVDLEKLVLVGLETGPVVESAEEVLDFLVAPPEDYELIRIPAAQCVGDLPAGIQSFLQTAVVAVPLQSFSACMSRVLGTDFRLLLECSLDSKLFQTYSACRAFSPEPMHPLRQSTARDNFVRHLRTDPDHTHLWEMVCRPGLFDGFNLLVFHGECKKETELIFRRNSAFDPTLRTIVLWKRGGQYALLRNAAATTFAFQDFEFLKKVAELKPSPKRAALTADALCQIIEKGNYETVHRVEHRGRIVGVVAAKGDKRAMLPCGGQERRLNLPDAAVHHSLVAEPLNETLAFLEAAARDLKIACRPTAWVQGAFGACVGVLTESHHFVPCKTGSCALPAVTVQVLQYGRGEATYMAARDLFRSARSRDVNSALDQWVEWVDNLPPELLTYPRYVNRKLIVLKSQRLLFVRRLTDELERFVHARCFLLNQIVYVKGRGHDVFETETLYTGAN